MLELALELPTQITAQAYPLPIEVLNVLETMKVWLGIIAGALAVVGLMMIGIGLFFKHRRGDGGEALGALGWWIAGVLLVAGASAIAAVFLPSA